MDRRGFRRRRCDACLLAALGSMACGGPAASESSETQPTWHVRLGGEGFQAPTAIADAGALTVVSGVFQDRMTVGGAELEVGGDVDGFVAALGPEGDVEWALPLAGPGADAAVALAPDGEGGVFLAGQAASGTSLAEQTFETTAESAALLARLGPDGSVLWAHVAQGSSFQAAMAVAALPDGAVYFGGDFTGEIDLGTGLISATDGGDAFIARFARDGQLAWVQVLSGSGIQHLGRLAVDTEGAVIAAGFYDRSLVVGDLQEPANPVTATTAFAAKLNADGEVEWVTTELLPRALKHERPAHAHGPGSTALGSLSLGVSPGGEVVSAVTYGDAFALHSQDFEAPSMSRMALTRFAPDGEILWQSEVEGESALILGGALAEPERTSVVTSWAGAIDVGDRRLESPDRRSLLLLDVNQHGSVARARQFGLAATALASDGAIAIEGATLVVGRWTDLESFDEDVFVGRFED
jgi:hypothetical protein